jgi:glycosyltransferase involved in cell wall biosynthesis
MEIAMSNTSRPAPLISIAMCTYNGGEYLKEQLNSVLSQTITDWELIIADDCSSDETRTILKDYAARDARITVVFNDQNLGYNKNFEKALQLCTSEYIAICDQDDVWRKDKLEVQFSAFGNNLLIYHDSEFIDRSGLPLNYRISDKFNFYSGDRAEVFLYFNCVSGHSIMMKKAVLEAALPFPEHFHYDQWLAYNAATLGAISFVNQPLVRYRQHLKNNTDMLALHSSSRDRDQKIAELTRESEWLLLCAKKAKGMTKELISGLYTLSLQRNRSFASLAYGMVIWKHKDLLLSLLKKSTVSKFFFTLRKIWGRRAKKLI